MKSTNFEIIKLDNEHVQFKVKGYGHGVGMSQTGADSLAKQGKNAEDIIHHFYSNVEIKRFIKFFNKSFFVHEQRSRL